MISLKKFVGWVYQSCVHVDSISLRFNHLWTQQIHINVQYTWSITTEQTTALNTYSHTHIHSRCWEHWLMSCVKDRICRRTLQVQRGCWEKQKWRVKLQVWSEGFSLRTDECVLQSVRATFQLNTEQQQHVYVSKPRLCPQNMWYKTQQVVCPHNFLYVTKQSFVWLYYEGNSAKGL